MAEALVGGAFLSAFLQVVFHQIASPEVVNFIKGRKLSAELLSKLETTANAVNGLIHDAEEQQITKPSVKNWLDRLKHAVYDADDLLDEIAYESLRSKLEPRKKKKQALGLNEGIGVKPSLHKVPTTSLVDVSGVFGRDSDREAILDFLLSDNPNGRNVVVISIVGMAGIGKTTLAQLVYNDCRVETQFDLRGWVCVSEEFNVFKLSKAILEEFTRERCHAASLNQVQLDLKDVLTGKKFVLVLDDVWNENYSNWDSLQSPLNFGAEGSKIIVTTRNENVASVMCTTEPYQLKQLDAEDCWFLFAKRAFGNVSSGLPRKLEIIGKQIAEKCKGLPLAAKTLGDLLRSRTDAREWEKVLKSKLWDLPNNDILPALRLSYHYLPSHLKRCFSYCAIFPKGYLFKKNELISLWMAEGLLEQPKRKMEIKEIGEAYFQDLILRSFFQQSGDDKSCFIMHDLMHDLAEFVSGDFCLRLEGGGTYNIPEMTRYSSHIRTEKDEELGRTIRLKGTFKGQLLRTLFLVKLHNSGPGCIDNEVAEDLSSLEHLRVLSLQRNLEVVELPNSIGNLKHLRHLDLSGAPFTRLPKSVTSLYNLQTLILFQCRSLIELPGNMGRLINLVYLDIRETELQKMPPQMGKLTKLQVLTHFILDKDSASDIKELAKLKHLQGELSIQNLQNVINAQDALQANMEVRDHLKNLEFRWAGEAENLEHIRDVLDKLRPHANLEHLKIIGYGSTHFPRWVGDLSFSNVVSLKLEECKNCSKLPPLGQLASLRDLSITAFDQVMYVGPEFYGSMQKPFPSLEILSIERLAQWEEWKDQARAFPVLQELYVRECPNLLKILPCHLPFLKFMVIEGCSKLVLQVPKSAATFQMTFTDDLRQVKLAKLSSGSCSLDVYKFHSMEMEWLPKILEKSDGLSTSLEDVEIRDSTSLKCFPLECFHNLKKLTIDDCPIFESLAAAETTIHRELTSLESLEIRNCPNFISFPAGGLHAPNLADFALIACLSLKSLPQCMPLLLPSLVDLYVIQCPKLESFPGDGLPSRLQILRIRELQNLTTLDYEGLKNLNCLEELIIRDCPKLQSVPECLQSLFPSLLYFRISGCPELGSFLNGGLPSKLEELQIYRCNKVISDLMEQDLRMLTSLWQLTLCGDCKDVESFPPETLLPSNLVSLEIGGFENLKSIGSKGLQYLSSLTNLEVWGCPKLLSLPEEGLPSSLSVLSVDGCPLLEQRYEPEKGDSWSKISHIPEVSMCGKTYFRDQS